MSQILRNSAELDLNIERSETSIHRLTVLRDFGHRSDPLQALLREKHFTTLSQSVYGVGFLWVRREKM